MNDDFFTPRPKATPTIYAYSDSHPEYKGMLKIGETLKGAIARITQQYAGIKRPIKTWTLEYEESAMRNDGTVFTDKDVHRYLEKQGLKRHGNTEFFTCVLDDVKAAIIAIRIGDENIEHRTLNFEMRPEQADAVNKTIYHFQSFKAENPNMTSHFLWNAKMRFGKTFAAYQLAKKMDWKRVLVLTFKPAVQSAWQDDLLQHLDFEGWQFLSRTGLSFEDADHNKPIVCFGSFQDYLGKNVSTGGIKAKNQWVHKTHWDCVILDEYHYGAWREGAKELFEAEDKQEMALAEGEGINYFDEKIMPIKTDCYLYLSGTPFRAISTGEFIEEQIFNWTYSDEQKAKEKWSNNKGVNPYSALPRMVLMTYQVPDSIKDIAKGGEYNEFDLNVFFSTEGEDEDAKFVYEAEVQKWLYLIRGAHLETTLDNLKLGAKKPPMPFSDIRLLNILTHTFWFMPSVASCYAMKNLIDQKQNIFYQDYNVIVAAGKKAGMGIAAIPPVLKAMDNPLKSKTITLSCGKLTTGISIKPWTGILMLRNLNSPETYFQAAFRVQTPWVIKNPDDINPNMNLIIKPQCYIFDFAPNRALSQIAEYSCRLNVNESNPEAKVAEFIHFLPILSYDGSSMTQVDAAGVLDIAFSGTTATMLARRWESALLVNVDNETLQRIMDSDEALTALMSIEGFRNLNSEIETIINKSESVNKAKKEANADDITAKEKKELTSEEKEYKNLRKKIQDKLIKFATRIPVFMYLTDYRERSLKDVITQIEPQLFKKVTGLEVKDFDLLISLNVFNSSLMNDAVYKFKRYEDASLEYAGIMKHLDDKVGGFDTVTSKKEYKNLIN